jgi:hypothetical protein
MAPPCKSRTTIGPFLPTWSSHMIGRLATKVEAIGVLSESLSSIPRRQRMPALHELVRTRDQAPDSRTKGRTGYRPSDFMIRRRDGFSYAGGTPQPKKPLLQSRLRVSPHPIIRRQRHAPNVLRSLQLDSTLSRLVWIDVDHLGYSAFIGETDVNQDFHPSAQCDGKQAIETTANSRQWVHPAMS